MVPEVNSNHSVVMSRAPAASAGPGTSPQRMTGMPTDAAAAGPVPSVTMASTSPAAKIAGRCAGARSGGQSNRRRAMPSRDSSASAAGNCRALEISTVRPRNVSGAALIQLPAARASNVTWPPASAMQRRGDSPDAAVNPSSERCSGSCILVELYEVAECHWKTASTLIAERVEVERVFERRHEDREAERVES